MKKRIEIEDVQTFENDYDQLKENIVKERTVTKNGIVNSCIDNRLLREMNDTFSIDNSTNSITNQKQTGRCWMFAGLNIIRKEVAKKLNCEDIELSQPYLQFYDKLEKANFFLEKAIELSSEEENSRLNTFIIDNAFQDGGQFQMFVNLIKKYGIVPLSVMPETAVSCSTGELNLLLTKYLTKAMSFLRIAKKKRETVSAIQQLKKNYLSEIYRILCISLGKPISSFTYEYTDKDKKHVTLDTLTPIEFYNRYVGKILDDYITLTNAPIKGHKEYQKYSSKYVNNVIEGGDVIFFNVPTDVLKKSTADALKDKNDVWFGADVSSMSLRKDGYLVDDIYNAEDLFDIALKDNKENALTYRCSFCNHAMTITGVNLDGEDKPNRWKVANSWGEENGKKGYYIMSDSFFDRYVYEVFVPKRYIPKEIVDKYNSSSIIYEEPFNTLYLNLK